MTPALQAEMLKERMEGIEQSVSRISEGSDPAVEAEHVRANLIDVLGLLGRNPGLDAAADDLHGSVRALITADANEAGMATRRVRLLQEAHLRFRARLEAAIAPST
ncbi:hypothetical protein J2X36_003206 [Methylobacterium sp. BE186]|uniref:hypothetical protein n=1 Tax=Methylobacterium sp. BE186 TaxID=2817715 RepID=UPI0028632339|nr:hypothetical protein [Methylobacterium sp. BE186]MDR7038442.1 hypothetical protein [Methylobacterium sp. BE186]